MAFKLLHMAEKKWRRITKPELVNLVAAGVTFVDGVQKKEKAESRKDAA
jgi:hypothetical protein